MDKKDEKEKVEKLDSRIKELEEKIQKLENEKAELTENWKRALADYKNLERRTEEERVFILEFANETLIRSLLPILDHLEMLLKHVNDEGLKMIVKDFQGILTDFGVQEIEVAQKEFDPAIMDAIDTVEGNINEVIEVLSKGYLFNNKLLRPAKVTVGKGK